MTTDHLANARSYIAIAESDDSQREAYARAADEIIAWLAEDTTRSMREADERLGRKPTYTQKLVSWRTSDDQDPQPFGGERRRLARENSQARKVLRDRPEVIREAIKSDPGLADRIVGDDPQVQGRLQGALDRKAEEDRVRYPQPVERRTGYSPGIALKSVLILSLDAKAVLKDSEVLSGLDDDAKGAVRRVFADVREALDTAEAVMEGQDVQGTIDRILAEAE